MASELGQVKLTCRGQNRSLEKILNLDKVILTLILFYVYIALSKVTTEVILFIPDLAVEEVSHVFRTAFYSGFQ